MTHRHRIPTSAAAALALAFALTGCLASNPPEPVRYFEPSGVPWAGPPTERAATPLRLARTSAAPGLGERMVWRLSEVELAFDELNRWAAQPATTVADWLHEALFLRGPYASSGAREAAELEVRVTTFEGSMRDPLEARVELVATLRRGSSEAARTRRFTGRAALASRGAEQLAGGMGDALRAALAELRTWLDRQTAP